MRESVTLGQLSYYFFQTDRFATALMILIKRHSEIESSIQTHKRDFAYYFGLTPIEKMVCLITIPCMLAAVVGQYVILGPIVSTYIFGNISNPVLKSLLSLFPVLVLLGVSVIAGYHYPKIINGKDEFHPKKLIFNWPSLISALIATFFYIGFYVYIKFFISNTVPDIKDTTNLLFPLAFCELIISTFAVKGFVILFSYLKNAILKLQARRLRRYSLSKAWLVAEQYNRYKQFLSKYNHDNGCNIPPEINEKIQEAILINAKKSQSSQFNNGRVQSSETEKYR
jgi:hypothetical protein